MMWFVMSVWLKIKFLGGETNHGCFVATQSKLEMISRLYFSSSMLASTAMKDDAILTRNICTSTRNSEGCACCIVSVMLSAEADMSPETNLSQTLRTQAHRTEIT